MMQRPMQDTSCGQLWLTIMCVVGALFQHGVVGAPPWPELANTPPMGWNGWLPSTYGLIPGYQNNETVLR
jgi:hypothetical protein